MPSFSRRILILLLEVYDHILVMAVDPSCQHHQEHAPGLYFHHHSFHPPTIHPENQGESL